MKVKLSKREQQVILLIGALAVLISWVYAVCIVGPLTHEAGTLEQEIRQARDQLRALEAVMGGEAAMREQYHQVEEAVKSFRGLLTQEAELPTVIGLLSDFANQTHVKIQTIVPQRSFQNYAGTHAVGGAERKDGIPLPVVYKEIPIQIDAIAGYHQLGAFLGLLEATAKPMQLWSLRISANPKEPKRHMVKLLVQSYVAPSEPASLGKRP